ncbi:MAG: universal stress protein [Cyanobacteria bacterium]|jgi:nucleotide-binding universal stress UspA family protein|nr:universal stress protein [Cyanobacteria bacterium GSL.Bin1]
MRKVLLYIDVNQLGSKLSFLERAVAYVRALEGQFLVMTVMPDYQAYFVSPLLPEQFAEKAHAKAIAALDEFATRYLPDELIDSVMIRYGLPHTQILAVAEEEQVDLIFFNADRPEPVDYLLGTMESRVNRHAACDVMFFHGH